jgi:subtilisin family serine protease
MLKQPDVQTATETEGVSASSKHGGHRFSEFELVSEKAKTKGKRSAKRASRNRTKGKQKPETRRVRVAQLKARVHAVDERATYAPGLLVVKCKEDVVANVPDIHAARVASVRALSLPKAVEDPFENLSQRQMLREIIPIFSRSTAGRSLSIAPRSVAASFAMSVRDSENEDLRGINMLRLARSANLQQIEKELQATPGIEYVHRVPRRWMATHTPAHPPRDPFVAQQWNLNAIQWFAALPLPDAGTVKVAVLDTGIDMTHPELRDVVQTYIHEGASSVDIIGHGTHVAGIITAAMNNKVGIAGVCRCDLSVWKIFTDTPDPEDGEYYIDDVMYQRALNAARNAGMRVVNLSIGGAARSQTEAFLFQRLISAGATVVAAMGNEFKQGNPTEYPAAYPGVVAVGATGKSNRRASFSNTGRHMAVSAPGLNILSTLPMKPSAARAETQYAVWSGTSMATPHVAATAALILARQPALSPQQVAHVLKTTATKLPAMENKNRTHEYGYGLLNVKSAVS